MALGIVLNIPGKELGSMLLRHWIKTYLELAYPRFRIHSVFKKSPLWQTDSYAGYTGYVWTEAEFAKKKLRIQKFPDTYERGLNNTFFNIQCYRCSLGSEFVRSSAKVSSCVFKLR